MWDRDLNVTLGSTTPANRRPEQTATSSAGRTRSVWVRDPSKDTIVKVLGNGNEYLVEGIDA